MIQLYYHPGSASMTPHILLEELGVSFELKFVDRLQGAHKLPDYRRLNPNGLIPVLVDGNLVLYETAAICMHLVDTHAELAMAPPPGSEARADFYKWMVWLSSTLHSALIMYFYPERWVDAGNAGGAAQVRAHAEARVGTLLDQIEAQLASHGGDWLLGEHFRAVDPYAFMLCRWTRGFGRPARSLPHVGPWLQRMRARPAVAKVFATEALPEPHV